uniref:Uncharacterized protein n=1 Tax=Nitrosopumivirus cobalaminus TaxID=3158414 RepID=A0AAU7N466_9VIRU
MKQSLVLQSCQLYKYQPQQAEQIQPHLHTYSFQDTVLQWQPKGI